MQELVRRLSKLSQASSLITRCHDLGPLLDAILQLVDEVFGCRSCEVLLCVPTGELRVERARGSERIHTDHRLTTGIVQEGRASLVMPEDGVANGVVQVGAPMILDGAVVGVLSAELPHNSSFSAEDLSLFATFADHATAAVQNAKLHKNLADTTAQLEREFRRLQLLSEAAAALSSTLDLDELLLRILDLSHEALRFDQSAVLLLDSSEGELTVRASIGYDESVSQLCIPVGQGVTGEVARTRRPLLVSDVTQDPRYIKGVSGGRCEMAAPLLVRGELIGVLDAESTRPGAFSEADLDLLATFALQAANAITNAETYQELEQANTKLHRNVIEMERMNRDLLEHTRTIHDTNAKLENRVHELLTLQEASRTITSSLDLDDTLQAIVRMTREIIRSSMSAIKLMDEESQELRVRVRHSDDSGENPTAIREVLGVPLRIGERTIGSFEVSRAGDGHFNDEEKRLLETLASQAAIAIENARLFENTQRTYFETIRSLAHALEARDSYTKGHSERVMRYALRTAEAMGVSECERRVLGHASLLHDIGKIGIADAVLNKAVPLTPEDRKMIENHPLFGDTIIGPLRFLDKVQALVRHHHERYDGTGYPEKLKGTVIPLGARIIAVADSFDAMTSNRPYRNALPEEAAIREIQKGAGSQFDPAVVNAFVTLLETKGPIPDTDTRFDAILSSPDSQRTPRPG